MSGIALVTGSTGAIGSAIVRRFKQSNFLVCGIDRIECEKFEGDLFIKADLGELVANNALRHSVLSEIRAWIGGRSLDVLINNAAYQYVSYQHPMPPSELSRSYNVNLIAPYLLITNLIDIMTPEFGSVVNIGSIHSKLTKPGFVAYSTTKAALAGLTRGLALDFEGKVRINCIDPASIETPMLLDGFKENPLKKEELEKYHPQKRIGSPEEVAEFAFMISSKSVRFLHGACIDFSGGISSRLHDPL